MVLREKDIIRSFKEVQIMTVNVLRELLNNYDGSIEVKIGVFDIFAEETGIFEIEDKRIHTEDNVLILCGILDE